MDEKKRILCLDANQDTCELLALLLEAGECEVIAVNCLGETAPSTLFSKFDLYVFDYCAVDDCSREFCRELRRHQVSTPVIFFTAAAFQREAGLAAGATAYIAKPNWDELLKTVRYLLKRSNDTKNND